MKIFIVLALIACASAFKLPSAELQMDREWHMQPRSMSDEDRIVGGSYGYIKDFPFLVSLRRYGSHMCGGTIIKSNRIVTAAHCTSGQSASTLSICAGQQNKNSDTDDWEQVRDVSSYANHGSYSSSTTNYDFAVLRLKSSVSYNTYVDPISMGSVGTGTNVYVSGWGATSEGGSLPNGMKWLRIPTISTSECNSAYSGSITSAMVCAGYMNKAGSDSCQGDSGGPLTISYGKSATLVGVVSWGYGCARSGFPGVYARVSVAKSWISGI